MFAKKFVYKWKILTASDQYFLSYEKNYREGQKFKVKSTMTCPSLNGKSFEILTAVP